MHRAFSSWILLCITKESPMQPVAVHWLWQFPWLEFAMPQLVTIPSFPFVVSSVISMLPFHSWRQWFLHLTVIFACSILTFSSRGWTHQAPWASPCAGYIPVPKALVSSCCTLSCLLLVPLWHHGLQNWTVIQGQHKDCWTKRNNHLLLHASKCSPGCV